MLERSQICSLTTIEGRDLVLEADESGYGIASGTRYGPGRNRVDRSDRGGKILVFRDSFSADPETLFLGTPPTGENCYEAKVTVIFQVPRPEAVCQTLLRQRSSLTYEAYEPELGAQMEPVFARLACEYAADSLGDETARDDAQQLLHRELTRICGVQGLSPKEVCLEYVRPARDRSLRELIRGRISREAEEQRIAEDVAFQQFKDEMARAAGAGDTDAETIVAELADVDSLDQLGAEPPKTPAKPVLLGRRNEPGGRFVVLGCDRHPEYYEILRSWFFLGRHNNCDVRLPSPAANSLHATVGRIGSSLLVVDHHSTYGTLFCGERIAQRFLATGDVLRMGDAWIVFKLEPGQEFRAVDRSCRGSIPLSEGPLPPAPYGAEPAGGGHNDNAAWIELVSGAAGCAYSDSRPILIGHDSTCNLRLSETAARFHAVVCWSVQRDKAGNIVDGGVYVEDLHSGHGTLLNREPVQRRKLSGCDVLEIGGHQITVTGRGDLRSRAEFLDAKRPPFPGLAILGIEGPITGDRMTLNPNQERIVLGRNEDCDFVIPCAEVSGEHAIIARELVPCDDGAYRPQFVVTDAGSTNGTSINRHVLQPGERRKIGPADVIRLNTGTNACDLLVHYDD